MFPIPDSYKTIKLVALDPGLNNIGVAVFLIDAVNLKILDISAKTLKEGSVLDQVCLDSDYATEQMLKRWRMVDAVMQIVRDEDPVIFVSESPFFNRKMPSSFAVLTEVINDIFTSILKHNNNIRIATVEPLLVKHTLGVAGQKGKDVVRCAMEKQEAILPVLKTPVSTLDEHAIDAVGVGYTFFKRRLCREK